MSETITVRVLVEQPETRGEAPVTGLSSGVVYDLPAERAKGLLATGQAEAVAKTNQQSAEKRAARSRRPKA